MASPFGSLHGTPFTVVLSASHEARLADWLQAQPARMDRRRARAKILRLAHERAAVEQVPLREGFELVLYQLEQEAEQAVPA